MEHPQLIGLDIHKERISSAALGAVADFFAAT